MKHRMKNRQPPDRRLSRTAVDFERRVNPYVYECEVRELSELLKVPIRAMQEMVNDKVEEYYQMSPTGGKQE